MAEKQTPAQAQKTLNEAIKAARKQYSADVDTARMERDAAIAAAYAVYGEFAKANAAA